MTDRPSSAADRSGGQLVLDPTTDADVCAFARWLHESHEEIADGESWDRSPREAVAFEETPRAYRDAMERLARRTLAQYSVRPE